MGNLRKYLEEKVVAQLVWSETGSVVSKGMLKQKLFYAGTVYQ